MLKRCDNTHGDGGVRAGGFDDGIGVKACKASSGRSYQAKARVS